MTKKIGPQSTQPKLLFKEETQIIHHCFRLEAAEALKNLSWRKGEVILERVPHVHFYHNVNSLGLTQTKSNDVGGHYHEVKWEINQDGYPVATCGPALRRVQRKLPNGKVKTSIEPIKFYDAELDKWVEDTHIHEVIYKHSNRIAMSKAQNWVAPQEPKRVDNNEVSLDVLG